MKLLTDNTRTATDTLAELQRYMATEAAGQLLFCQYEAIPGLIPLGNAEQVYRNYRTLYQTPWGLADKVNLMAGYYRLGYIGLYRLLEPSPAAPPAPIQTAPALATAVVNPLTGFTVVYAGQQTPETLAAAAPAWEGKIQVDKVAPRNLLEEVKTALCAAYVPYYPALLYTEDVTTYPWLRPDGLPAAPATVANHELSVPLTGYVVDTTETPNRVIYLSVVGHKTATRSLWASLSTNARRVLTVETGNRQHGTLRVESTHNYATFTTVLDADTGLQRLQIVDKRVFSPDCMDTGAYLVLPAGMDTTLALAARLNAVLPIPVPADWDLCQPAADLQLLQRCACGGDVALAWVLKADPQWLTLIDAGLKAGTLTI